MATQVHVPPGQASGSRSIWHLHRAQVLHYFPALCLWRPARSGGPPRLCVHPEVSDEPSPAACPPYPGGDQKQRGKRQAGPVSEPAALSTPAPQLPGPTNNAPARARRTHHPGQRPISTREAGLGHGSASRARQGLLLALRGRSGPPLAPTAARRAPRS